MYSVVVFFGDDTIVLENLAFDEAMARMNEYAGYYRELRRFGARVESAR
jgi:hypothetical protein